MVDLSSRPSSTIAAMFGRLKTWLLSLRDDTVADQRSEISGLKAELAALAARTAKLDDLATRTLEDWRHDVKAREAAHDRIQRTLLAVLRGASIGAFMEEWLGDPGAAESFVCRCIEERIQAVDLRAGKAERDAEDLRAALADERRQHDQTRGALNASEAENAEVWARIEKIRAQTAADIAIQARRKAIAETDARRKPEDDESA